MDYKKYQHIEKIGTTEVEGILNGTCYISYKIDGTNSVVWYDKDTNSIRFGSRNRELSLDNDNANFMQTLTSDVELLRKLKLLFNKFPDAWVYGEWLVPHTLKTYEKDAWRKFYIFDIRLDDNTYVCYDEYSPILNEIGLDYIPILAKLENPKIEELEALLDKTGDFLIDNGLGEGIVIKNYQFLNRYGRRTWAKMLTEDFKNNKQKSRSEFKQAKEEDNLEYLIIRRTMTSEHILKEKSKIEEIKGDWSSKYIFELLGRVFNEWFKDNWEIILKKFKYPTINFKKLKQFSDEYVKEVIGI